MRPDGYRIESAILEIVEAWNQTDEAETLCE
jgi:hypothetical protein